MKANGLAYFIDALSVCVRSELALSCLEGEEPFEYTDNQLIEHILPPRPKTNELKAARRAAAAEARKRGLNEEQSRAFVEDALLELDIEPRSASILSRLKKHSDAADIIDEFLLSNELDESHANDLAAVAHDAQYVMRKLARRETVFFSMLSKKDTSGKNFARMGNAVRAVILSGAFPVMANTEFKEAVLAFLQDSHQDDCLDEFVNTLAVLMRDEQELSNEAIAAKGSGASYLDARIDIMAYLLAVALCGSAGVKELSRDSFARADLPTRYSAVQVNASHRAATHEACLVEQLLDSEGNLMFGEKIPLDRNKVVYIGRAPEPHNDSQLLHVRYVADGVGSTVSRLHAVMRFCAETGCWHIRDAESYNGTAVAALEVDSTSNVERFTAAHYIDNADPGTALSNGDVVFLAPLESSGGNLAPNPHGATFRLVIL